MYKSQILEYMTPTYKLVGENLEGKIWVFDGSHGNGKHWWFMSDPANAWGEWWNAGDCCAPPDAAGMMLFDLNGAANFTYHTSGGSAGELGSWKFNPDYKKLIIGGGKNLLGAASNGSGNPGDEYTIVELTDDRLVLHTGSNGAGTGWTWVFIPKP